MINYEKIKTEHIQVSGQLSDENVIADREKYQLLAKRFAFLEKLVNLIKKQELLSAEKKHLLEVLANPQEDEEFIIMAKDELSGMDKKISAIEEEIEEKLFEEDEPAGDVIIEIRAGVGGEEASLFAMNLFKMYTRYIERNNWKFEILNSHATELKGFKEVIFSVRGQGAYSHLKFESGVHRVQRVPDTEASGRIHTSTVTVVVMIEPKEIELNIRPEDLKIEVCRASGAGGQHVNKTESAVRMVHLPTGAQAACQDERSQMKNREKAMKILKLRIMEKIEKEQLDKLTNLRRNQVGSGDRSEKIRTYNFPERRVSDHRINFTIYRLETFLEGDMDEVIKALIKAERQKIYAQKGFV